MSYKPQDITVDLANSAKLYQRDTTYPTGTSADGSYALSGYSYLDAGQLYDGTYYTRLRWFYNFNLPTYYMNLDAVLHYNVQGVNDAGSTFYLQVRGETAGVPPALADWPDYGATVFDSILSTNLPTGWNTFTIPASALASVTKLFFSSDREIAGTEPTGEERALIYANAYPMYLTIQVPLDSKAPTEIKVFPITDGNHVQAQAIYNAAGTNGNTLCTYVQYQVSNVSDFSTILYDTGQIAGPGVADGGQISRILDWFPSSSGTYYIRIATWDDDNYVLSAVWGSTSFYVGYPIVNSLDYTHNKENYKFTTVIQDTYTKPPVVSLNIDNKSELMELKKRDSGSGNPNPSALSFDGVDDYVEVLDDASLNVVSAFTLEAWVNVKDSANYRGVISKTESNLPAPFDTYIVSGTTTMRLWIGNGTSSQNLDLDVSGVVFNTWQHWAFVYDGTNIMIYLNGNLVAGPTAVTVSVGDTGKPVRIGNRNDEKTPMDGIIDEVRIWNVARTQAEIQDNMDKELTGTETGLVGYWKFNEGAGTIAYDTTANGNDGTIYGATWTNDVPFTSYSVDFYDYTYQKILALEKGKHDYHVEVGNVWTLLTDDTRHLQAKYKITKKQIKVFWENTEINAWNVLVSEKLLPDLSTAEFITDTYISSGNVNIKIRADGYKEFEMKIKNIDKSGNNWHVSCISTAQADFQQTVSFASEAINSLDLLKSILPEYHFFGTLDETVILQQFIDEKISTIINNILILNNKKALERKKKIYIFDTGTAYPINYSDTKINNFTEDRSSIVNKVREYYTVKQYPVPQNTLTNYDAVNWGGTVSDVQKTDIGLGAPSGNSYFLKATDNIYRTIDFNFNDFDHIHLNWNPETATSLEIRLETNSTNYYTHSHTFSGSKGAGFILTGNSQNDVVTKSITFTQTKISKVEGYTSDSCNVRITLKKAGVQVAQSSWFSGNVYFGQVFNNVDADEVYLEFTNLYVVNNTWGVNCYRLFIEEYIQKYQATGTKTFVPWQKQWKGTTTASTPSSGGGFLASVIQPVDLGPMYPLNSYDTFYFSGTASIEVVRKLANGSFWHGYMPVTVTSSTENGRLMANFSFQAPSDATAVYHDVSYNISARVERTVSIGEYVWVHKGLAWSETYNLWDGLNIPLSAFSKYGSPTSQINTIRLVATGDNYYDVIYFTTNNPNVYYVEVSNDDSIEKWGEYFQIRKTDGWSSEESARAFAQGLVNMFGNSIKSFTKEVPIYADIQIGDQFSFQDETLYVYKVVYDWEAGTKTLYIGMDIKNTLNFLKDTAKKIEALEKNIM